MRINIEELQMLYMTISDIKSGFCLIKYDDKENQTELIKKISRNLSKSNVIIDFTELNADELPDEISKMRALLAKNPESQVVFISNLQECGKKMDEIAFLEKFNYMRDQMESMKKTWVFVSMKAFTPTFNRYARDLYSCIMYHFDLCD